MIIVGERLNSSRKGVFEALQEKDEYFLLDQALKQEQAGAHYIDINSAALVDREIEILRWAIPLLQDQLKVPLSIDTPNPEAMEQALRIYKKGRPLLNSLTGETKNIQNLSPLIREFKPKVIVLCLDDHGFPETPDDAVSVASRMADLLQNEGLTTDDFFIDPLVRPAGVSWEAIPLFLKSIEAIKKTLPRLKTIAGISNVGFGLPQRRLLNRTLLALALEQGLDAAIMDPLDMDLQSELFAAEALLGKDPSLKNYLKFIRSQSPSRSS
jgi:5-methyltetrahydrofolate--homocysteine methyltransferase